MKKRLFTILIALLLFPVVSYAQVPDECTSIVPNNFKNILDRAACSGGISSAKATGTEASVLQIVSDVLQIVYGFLGVLFALLIVYAGFLYLTARGNTEQVERAQSYIRNAVIGIIILFTAFVITREIVSLLGTIAYNAA